MLADRTDHEWGADQVGVWGARFAALMGAGPWPPWTRAGMNPVLSAERVRLFEERYGVALPPPYRMFLMTVGDGWPGARGIWSLESCYGPGEENARPGHLATPFPHTSEVRAGDDLDDDEWDALTTGSMIIGGHSGCGSMARLIVTGPAAGQVWEDCLSVNGMLYPGPSFGVWYPTRLPRKPR